MEVLGQLFAYLPNSDHSLKRFVVAGVEIILRSELFRTRALTYLLRQARQKLAILSRFPILSLALGPHSQT